MTEMAAEEWTGGGMMDANEESQRQRREGKVTDQRMKCSPRKDLDWQLSELEHRASGLVAMRGKEERRRKRRDNVM
jgi:hypothetical protein